jgi:hypothetical protein
LSLPPSPAEAVVVASPRVPLRHGRRAGFGVRLTRRWEGDGFEPSVPREGPTRRDGFIRLSSRGSEAQHRRSAISTARSGRRSPPGLFAAERRSSCSARRSSGDDRHEPLQSRALVPAFRINAESGLSKYATDDRGQKDRRGGQEQSGNNLFSQSNAASSSRSARLTARIEFGGPQFLLRCVDDGTEPPIAPAPTAGSRKSRRSAGSASRAPAGVVAASVPRCRR